MQWCLPVLLGHGPCAADLKCNINPGSLNDRLKPACRPLHARPRSSPQRDPEPPTAHRMSDIGYPT